MERNQMRNNETQGVNLKKAVSGIFFITPKFESSAVFYVNNSFSLGGASLSIDSGGKGYDKKHYNGKYRKYGRGYYGSHYRRTAGEKSAVKEAADASTEE